MKLDNKKKTKRIKKKGPKNSKGHLKNPFEILKEKLLSMIIFYVLKIKFSSIDVNDLNAMQVAYHNSSNILK